MNRDFAAVSLKHALMSTSSVLMMQVDYLSFDSLRVQVRLQTSLPGLLSGSTQKKPCRSNWNLHRQTKLLLFTKCAQYSNSCSNMNTGHAMIEINHAWALYLLPAFALARCTLAMQPVMTV